MALQVGRDDHHTLGWEALMATGGTAWWPAQPGCTAWWPAQPGGTHGNSDGVHQALDREALDHHLPLQADWLQNCEPLCYVCLNCFHGGQGFCNFSRTSCRMVNCSVMPFFIVFRGAMASAGGGARENVCDIMP